MSTTTKLTAGAISSWTAAFGTEINSLANGKAVLSSIDIDNSTANDMWLNINIQLSIASTTLTAGAICSVYPAWKNQDGTTYGDNQITTTPATVSPGMQPALIASPTITTVATTKFAAMGRIPLLQGQILRLILYNGLLPSTALAASPGNVYVSTTNLTNS